MCSVVLVVGGTSCWIHPRRCYDTATWKVNIKFNNNMALHLRSKASNGACGAEKRPVKMSCFVFKVTLFIRNTERKWQGTYSNSRRFESLLVVSCFERFCDVFDSSGIKLQHSVYSQLKNIHCKSSSENKDKWK